MFVMPESREIKDVVHTELLPSTPNFQTPRARSMSLGLTMHAIWDSGSQPAGKLTGNSIPERRSPGRYPVEASCAKTFRASADVRRPASPSLSSAPPRRGPGVKFHLTTFYWRLHLGLRASFDRRDLALGPLALQTTPEEHGYFGSNCLGYAIPPCSVLHPNPSGF